MITLVPMTEEEFQHYCRHAIAEYAEDHIRDGRWSVAEALDQSARAYQELLPDGLATPDQYLYTVYSSSREIGIGMIWFGLREQAGVPLAFVYDVVIEPAFRRQGYATQAFRALEKQVQKLGLASIGLHVFGHNHGAYALYQKLGYVATNINMSKSLTPR